MFLLGEGLAKDRGDLHRRYLEAIHAEDVDERGQPYEKGVRAPSRAETRSFPDAVEKETLGEEDDSQSLAGTMTFLHRLGSGHVHGRAASVMTLYCTGSRSFRTDGLEPDDLGRAFVLMAVPGGRPGRSGGPPPGQTVIWRGYAGLAVMARTCGRLVRMDGAGLLYQKLRSDRSCVS